MIGTQTLVESLLALQNRAERLEKEAASIRRELVQITDSLAGFGVVVTRYEMDEHNLEVTESDVESAMSGLAKPWDDDAIYDLAAIKKLASEFREQSPQELRDGLRQTIHEIRSEAEARGAMIDDDTEAALGD